MRPTHLLLALAALAGCASHWTLVASEAHPALKPGTEIVTYERGRGAEHERKVAIRTGMGEASADSVDALMPLARPIDSPEAAIAYSDLVRELEVADSGAVGMVVRPDPTLTGTGGSGRYSRGDAAAWGVEFEPTARPNGGGFEVTRVVLHRPKPHPVLPNAGSPWRLVLLREVVSRDGTIRVIDQKTLTNGTDAARFAGH